MKKTNPKSKESDTPIVRPKAGMYPAGLTCKVDFKPFMGVEWDHIRTIADGRRFHIIAYRAYNAHGLIGSEHNGVAVVQLPLDRRKKGGDVLVSNLYGSSSGWSGLTQAQLDVAYDLAVCSPTTFVWLLRILVNLQH